MSTDLDPQGDRRVDAFLRSWTDLASPGQSHLLAEQVLVGTEAGATVIGRDAFVDAARARLAQAGRRDAARMTGWEALVVGEGLLLVTATWAIDAAGCVTLVSDFLLQKASDSGLQCVAYLPRQDVTTLLPSEA